MYWAPLDRPSKLTTQPYAHTLNGLLCNLEADTERPQVFLWPGVTEESLKAKPFHIYDKEFYQVIGDEPSLTLVASSESDPLFHEAVTW